MLNESTIMESISKSLNESKIVELSNSEMGELVAGNFLDYKKPVYSDRVSKSFVQKALWNDESTWYVLVDGNEVLAAAPTIEMDGSLLIEEFMSFRKGSGAELLLYILSLDYDMIYLFADWSQPDSLLEYYRDKRFGLTEKMMKNDTSHDTHYFYLNKKLSQRELDNFIDKNFIV